MKDSQPEKQSGPMPVEHQWLRSASNSLANLEKVSTNIYNLCLQDSRNLSARSTKGYVLQSPTYPQRNAWGSSSSIPDLVRQYTDRQSGKSSVRTSRSRPSSAKRPPHSSKAPAHQSDRSTCSDVPAVCGARCDLMDRPPDGSVGLHVAIQGWVAPPAGLFENIRIADKNENYNSGDNDEVTAGCIEDCNQMPTCKVTQDEVKVMKEDPPSCRSPERICFTLPHVSDDVEESFDTARLFDNNTKEKNQIDHDSLETEPDGGDRSQQDSVLRRPVSAVKRGGLVSRPPSGRSDHLRNVKSRISSGVVYRQRPHSGTLNSESSNRKTAPIVTVMFDEGNDDKEEDVSEKKQKKKRHSATKVESANDNSNMTNEEKFIMQGNDNENNGDKPDRPLSANCYISRNNVNYYDVAMLTALKQIAMKTTTTIELADGGLKEIKSQNPIEGQVLQQTCYTPNVPCPRKPQPRPSSVTEIKHPPLSGKPPITPPVEVQRQSSDGAAINALNMRLKANKTKITTHVTSTLSAHDIHSTNKVKLRHRHSSAGEESSSKLSTTKPVVNKLNEKAVGGDMLHNQSREKKAETKTLETSKTSNQKHNCLDDKGRSTSDKSKKDVTYQQQGKESFTTNRKEVKISSHPEPHHTAYAQQDEYDSDGLAACRQLHFYLLENDVPVSLNTLQRALLPPSEYRPHTSMYQGKSSKTLPNYTAGLLSKPSYWLVEEAKRVRACRIKVKKATARLLAQKKSERKKEIISRTRSASSER